VHRSQGATTDVSHRYADGGGRELACVGMSRARGPSFVYAVADDVVQAKEDLARDWTAEARQRWVLDPALPAKTHERERPTERIDAARRLQRLEAEQAAVRSAGPGDYSREIARLEERYERIDHDRHELLSGRGRYGTTDAGGRPAPSNRRRSRSRTTATMPRTPTPTDRLGATTSNRPARATDCPPARAATGQGAGP
jgi:hypothetical protein